MKYAILGLGAMGQRMAARAVQAGLDVVVWNRTPRSLPGARVASSPRDAAEGADVVLTMLTHIEASQAVWHHPDTGALAGLKRGALAVESSTLTPAYSQRLAQQVGAVGAHYVEAPVVGTRPHAEQGNLTVLAGGPAEQVAVAAPLFDTYGKTLHVGDVGSAMTLKLAINSLFAGQVVLLGEALSLLDTAGIGQDSALGILEKTPVFAPVLAGIAALLRAQDDAPRFPVALVHKDLQYAGTVTDTPLFDAVRQRYQDALDAELGDRNIHAVTRLYRRS